MTPLEHIDFKPLIAKETNGRMRVRLMALSHIKDGANNAQVARNLHISRRSVNDWVKRFYEHGLGTRPRAVKQQQFEYAYLFGAVCPATGDTEALIAPFMNMDVMEKHLSLISKKAPKGRHAIIVVDGAAWHQAHLAEKFDNLSIIKLPPYSPELNPIEQVWQWLRK